MCSQLEVASVWHRTSRSLSLVSSLFRDGERTEEGIRVCCVVCACGSEMEPNPNLNPLRTRSVGPNTRCVPREG